MKELIIFLLGTVGMTHIIVDGVIFLSFRAFLKKNLPEYLHNLFECYMCCGFWSGVFLGALLISKNPYLVFACGCTGSLLSQLHASILNVLESLTIKLTNDK